jgi:UDP-N-acetylmuramate dehydrogenase
MKPNDESCRMLAQIAELCDGETLFDERLAKHTTWRIGGPADLWVAPETVTSVTKMIASCYKLEMPWIVLGSGSNVLVGDDGYRGVIINLERAACVLDISGLAVEIGAGRQLSDLDRIALEHNLSGPEHWAGIPGTIGGAVAGNAGAFGAAVCSFATELHLANADGDGWMPMAQIPHHYRHCHLLPNTAVLAARFTFTPDQPETIKARRRECTMQRVETQPAQVRCAGSVFRNPPDTSAGALLDAAGLKGLRHGAAEVSEKHANFILNTGGASADDVLWIIREMRRRVAKTTDVTLETEIRLVGDIDMHDEDERI